MNGSSVRVDWMSTSRWFPSGKSLNDKLSAIEEGLIQPKVKDQQGTG